MSLERVTERLLEIFPAPSALEQRAIVAALQQLAAEQSGSRPDAWWQAGVQENLEDGEAAGSR